MAKQYEKDAEAEEKRQRTIQKEAKKLRQFLEDYQDERDDPKYYKFEFINLIKFKIFKRLGSLRSSTKL